jgi:hypothetical protein
MNYPIIENTPTLSKYGYAVYIYDPQDGGDPIFKIARNCPGSIVTFEKEEIQRFFPTAGVCENILGKIIKKRKKILNINRNKKSDV